MAIEKVQSGIGQDKFAQMYSKYNATVDALEAGSDGDVLLGVSPGSDPVFGPPPVVGIKFLDPIDIGNWNMLTTASVNVAHGLTDTDWEKIRCIHVVIRNDNDDERHDLVRLYTASAASAGGSTDGWGDTYIKLIRVTGGLFDDAAYNASPYNRGFITIGVIE